MLDRQDLHSFIYVLLMGIEIETILETNCTEDIHNYSRLDKCKTQHSLVH